MKKEIANNMNEMTEDHYRAIHGWDKSPEECAHHLFLTSGSSGAPKRSLLKKNMMIPGILEEWNPLTGLKGVCVDFCVAGKAWSSSHFFRELSFAANCCYLQIGALESQEDFISQWKESFLAAKPVAIFGNVTQLNTLALALQQSNTTLESVRSIVWTAEPMTSACEALLQQVFPQAGCFSVYGSTETWVIGYQTPGMDRDEFNIFSFQEVQVDSKGMLVTCHHPDNLNPIKRYRLADDIDVLQTNEHNKAPTKIRVKGRKDKLLFVNGNKIDPQSIFQCISQNLNIRESQLCLETLNDKIQQLTLLVCCSKPMDLEELKQEILAADLQNKVLKELLTIKSVEKLNLTRTGKAPKMFYKPLDSQTVKEKMSSWQEAAHTLDRGQNSQEYYQRRLGALWQRAKQTPFYSNLPDEFSWDAFQNLPVVSKDEMKNNLSKLINPKVKPIRYFESSGTTGNPSACFRSEEDLLWNYQGVAKHWGQIVTSESRGLCLQPSDVTPIGDLIAGVSNVIGAGYVRCFPYTTGLVSWDRILRVCENYKPDTIWASPGTLVQFTRMLKKRGKFAEISKSIKTIMLSGEVFAQSLQNSLAEKWDAQVCNASYGSTEMGTIAAVDGTGRLRMLTSSYYCEIKTEDGIKPLAPGLKGELVVSALNSFAQPLLRVSTGDTVQIHQDADLGYSIEVFGRQGHDINVGAKHLDQLRLEEMIYQVKGTLGYQLVASKGQVDTVILEREPGCPHSDADIIDDAKNILNKEELKLQTAVVHELPILNKSGGSLKNWKRSHVIERAR